MCIRDSLDAGLAPRQNASVSATRPDGTRVHFETTVRIDACLLYTSDAADERSSVDLGGRRMIKKKKKKEKNNESSGAKITITQM